MVGDIECKVARSPSCFLATSLCSAYASHGYICPRLVDCNDLQGEVHARWIGGRSVVIQFFSYHASPGIEHSGLFFYWKWGEGEAKGNRYMVNN